jgi:uncharacterized membrane-anchored protein YhcB (DUF1043 family)
MSHLSVQTELDTVSSDLQSYFRKQAQLLSLLLVDKYKSLYSLEIKGL